VLLGTGCYGPGRSGSCPRGRIVEIFGAESSGKRALIYHVIAEAQKLGGVCAFIDAEHAMGPLRRNLGVNIGGLLVSRLWRAGARDRDMLVRLRAVDVLASTRGRAHPARRVGGHRFRA
jgi:recombination protein RecA